MTASITRSVLVGDLVRHGEIIRTVSATYAGTLDLVDGEGHLVAVVGEDEVDLVKTIAVTYRACARCQEAASECSCHSMTIGITY